MGCRPGVAQTNGHIKNRALWGMVITVCNYVHIGNARPVVVFDCLYRLLSVLYPQVVYARNITDIDDKIIDAALQRGTDIAEVSTEFTQKYREDMAALNALAPTIEPMAPSTSMT